MTDKTIYTSRMVGGMAVIAMPIYTATKKYTRTEGKNGMIYMRPVKSDDDAMGEQL